jgi:lipopolysaccharide transport system permease protein
MEHDEKNDWDIIIEGSSSLFDLKLQDLWNYRDLLWMFVKRDFVSFYKQTILGPIWFFIQPLFTTIIYTFIFGGLASLSTDGLPQPLFYLAGITAWNYFADCLTKTSNVFKDNLQIFGKVYFPRLILPLSIIVSNLVRFAVQMILFIILMFYYFFQNDIALIFSWNLLLFPILVVLMAFLGLGLGLIVTAMTTKYRDLAFLVTFGVQLLMYTTTVIYPLSAAPSKFKRIIELNPMTGIIEAFRYSLLGKGEFNVSNIGYSIFVTVFAMLFGIIIFNRTEKTFVDSI